MVAKQKFIRRVYEKGKETTAPSLKKRLKATTVKKPSDIKEAPAMTPAFLPQPERKRVLIDSYELPAHYDATRVVLMPKDPFWLYAYWEIAPNSIVEIRDRFGYEAEGSKITLRMYDITYKDFNGYNANHYFDLELDPHTNNWYVNLWHDNLSYCAELGLKASSGRFFPMARSNYAHTPRASYSPRTEQIWMQVNDDAKGAPYIETRMQPITQTKAPSSPMPGYTGKGRKIYLAEDEIRRYYAGLTPALREIISSRLIKLYDRREHRYSLVLEGETEAERNNIYSRLPKYGLIKKLILGSSESLLELGGSEQRLSGASEFKAQARKFFFEIGTELLIYGRTEPDAQVWLGDKKIELRPDGTFSLRFGLSLNSKIPMEFKAISSDRKETREIKTSVERATEKKD